MLIIAIQGIETDSYMLEVVQKVKTLLVWVIEIIELSIKSLLNRKRKKNLKAKFCCTFFVLLHLLFDISYFFSFAFLKFFCSCLELEKEEKPPTKVIALGLSTEAELEPISDEELDNMGDICTEETSEPKAISRRASYLTFNTYWILGLFNSLTTLFYWILGIAETLQVDWASLMQEPTPKMEADISRRARYDPIRIIAELGVSQNFAGRDVVDEIQLLCERNGINNQSEYDTTIRKVKEKDTQ